ncbi:MAG TPA: crossover junction endodeoxyribonuclease RuvC [Candidatus Binatia bacterium]|nr:crossover junction endodeoxyribonuclease RuvC [Candidatus Binatia bacterium]
MAPADRVGLLLGVDPGLANTGWALLDAGGTIVDSGTIRTRPGPTGPRLLHIVSELRGMLAAYPVGEAALEELFLGRNATSAVAVAQARGAVLTALSAAGIAVHEYKPSQVKSVLTGYGAAGKRQMTRMVAVQGRTGSARPPRMDDHAADAAAIAMCHARSRRLRQAVEGGAGGAPPTGTGGRA